MELILFKDNDHYLKAQRRTRRKRSGNAPYFTSTEFKAIKSWLHFIIGVKNRDVSEIICHGAFKGNEIDEFELLYPGAHIIGTDLAPESPDVIEHDFRTEVGSWIGTYDILYSNSLDHADEPRACIRVWLDQLKDTGVAFIQWTRSHIDVRGGDCFGAHLHEYIMLFDQEGKATGRGVIDLLYCGGCVTVLVVGKLNKEISDGI